MNEPTDADWIRQSIAPKSDQLNADDLISGPMEGEILDVRRGSDEQPVCITLDCHSQPYKPCKSMLRVMVSVWGNQVETWRGQRLRLWRDPSVKWGGVKVGGIRIQAMSGITERASLTLTQSRGKRSAYMVEPLGIQSPQASHDKLVSAFGGLGVTVEAIESEIGGSIDRATDKDLEGLRKIYRSMLDGKTWAEATEQPEGG